MNCYFICQKLSKFSKTWFITTKETALAPFNLAHPWRVVRRIAHRYALYYYLLMHYDVCLSAWWSVTTD